MNNYEYKINDKVIHLATNKECIVVATKEIPYCPKSDPFNRPNRYPEKDYLLLILVNITDGNIANYLGELDVFKSEIKILDELKN